MLVPSLVMTEMTTLLDPDEDGKPCSTTIGDYEVSDFPEISALWQRAGLGGVKRGDTPAVIDHTIRAGGVFLVMKTSNTGQVIGTS